MLRFKSIIFIKKTITSMIDGVSAKTDLLPIKNGAYPTLKNDIPTIFVLYSRGRIHL